MICQNGKIKQCVTEKQFKAIVYRNDISFKESFKEIAYVMYFKIYASLNDEFYIHNKHLCVCHGYSCLGMKFGLHLICI